MKVSPSSAVARHDGRMRSSMLKAGTGHLSRDDHAYTPARTPRLPAGHRLLRPMHSWAALLLATTAAFVAGALLASAGHRAGAGVAIAAAVHGSGPTDAAWHLRSLFQVTLRPARPMHTPCGPCMFGSAELRCAQATLPQYLSRKARTGSAVMRIVFEQADIEDVRMTPAGGDGPAGDAPHPGQVCVRPLLP